MLAESTYGNTASHETVIDAMRSIADIIDSKVGKGKSYALDMVSHSVTYDGVGGFVGTYFFTYSAKIGA